MGREAIIQAVAEEAGGLASVALRLATIAVWAEVIAVR
jgi:hypothetical protein